MWLADAPATERCLHTDSGEHGHTNCTSYCLVPSNSHIARMPSTVVTHFLRDALYISFFSTTGMASMMIALSVGDRAWPTLWHVSCSMEALLSQGRCSGSVICRQGSDAVAVNTSIWAV